MPLSNKNTSFEKQPGVNLIDSLGFFEKKTTAADGSGRELYLFQIADESVNRNGWQLVMGGLDWKEYFQTGAVFLFDHDTSLGPIGRAEEVFVQNNIAYAWLWFHEQNDESIFWKAMVDLGIVKSISPRISPLEDGGSRPLSDFEKKNLPFYYDTVQIWNRSSLREISLVNIPAYTGSVLQQTIRAAYQAGDLAASAKDYADEIFQKFYDTKSNINSNTGQFTNLKGDKNMSLEIENANLKNELANIQKERDSFKASFDDLKNNNSELSSQNAKLNDDLVGLKKSNANMEKELKDLRAADEANQKKQVENEIDSFINANKDKLTATEAEGRLREKLLHLKANEKTMNFKNKSLYELEKEDIQARESGEIALELEIDNFIAANKEKIPPKELKKDALKEKLIRFRKASETGTFDKSLYELACSEIEAREKGFGLSGEQATSDNTKAGGGEITDFSKNSYTEILANAELNQKFDEHVRKVAKDGNLAYAAAWEQEIAKLKAE